MERKNAEKKLSIQKRDRKIRDLEEIIKIKDDELKPNNISGHNQTYILLYFRRVFIVRSRK